MTLATWLVCQSLSPSYSPPDEESPPRPVNVEQIIEEEHAREMPDTLTIIRDVVHIADDIVQEVMRIASTSHPALTYQIARRHRHGRQQG